MRSLCLVIFLQSYAVYGKYNGFNVYYTSIPLEQIVEGGPRRDEIPAIDAPKMISVEKAKYLREEDLVLAYSFKKEAKAYPLRILLWHQVINDKVGEKSILLTYCPFSNAAMVFERKINGKVLSFGVSGLLWNSNLLLYDRETMASTQSLWSQAGLRAITNLGAEKKLKLKTLPFEYTTWKQWKNSHPKTLVMSVETGFKLPYQTDPYAFYRKDDNLFFPVEGLGSKTQYLNKEVVTVVSMGDQVKAYVFRDVADVAGEKGWMLDKIGKVKVKLTVIPEAQSLRVEAKTNFSVVYLYWFSLKAFMPQVPIFEKIKNKKGEEEEMTPTNLGDLE